MIVDMGKVSWLGKDQIGFQAKELFFLNPEPKIRREHKWQG
jgi:hypothetical protein